MVTLTFKSACEDVELFELVSVGKTLTHAAADLLVKFQDMFDGEGFPELFTALADIASGESEYRYFDFSCPEDAFILTVSNKNT